MNLLLVFPFHDFLILPALCSKQYLLLKILFKKDLHALATKKLFSLFYSIWPFSWQFLR